MYSKDQLNEMLRNAIGIAYMEHKDSTDKNGDLYILHPLWVMSNVKTVYQKIVAVLHDVVEDTRVTLIHLKNLGFPQDIIDAINAISRRDYESYDDYITRVSENKLATAVKIVDIQHNISPDRVKNLSFEAFQKYSQSLEYLQKCQH